MGAATFINCFSPPIFTAPSKTQLLHRNTFKQQPLQKRRNRPFNVKGSAVRESLRGDIDRNSHVTSLCKQGLLKESLHHLHTMEHNGVRVYPGTYTSVLQMCVDRKALTEAKTVHEQLIRSGVRLDIFLRNHLISMYSKFGMVEDARQVFDKMSERNVVSWSAMIAGYAQNGHYLESLQEFCRFVLAGLKPNKFIFASVLVACSNSAELKAGMQIYAYMIKCRCSSHGVLGSAVVNMFVKCGCIELARVVFERLPVRTLTAWTAMIVGYTQDGNDREGIGLFLRMQETGMKLDQFVFSIVLRAIGGLLDLELGKQIHAHVVKSGYDSDVSAATPLVDMYAKCGDVEDAREVFDRMPQRNVVSWCAMMAGYVDQKDGEEVFSLFKQMQGTEVKPNQHVFCNLLNACGMLGALEQGKQVHAHFIKTGLISDSWGEGAVVTMYASSGSIEDAQKIYNTMLERDLDVKSPVEIKMVHEQLIRTGVPLDTFLGNYLINTYSKFGLVQDARQVFDKLSEPNIVSWSSMIAGYAQNGEHPEALQTFRRMLFADFKPNQFIFAGILRYCLDPSKLELGKQIYAYIIKDGCSSDTVLGSAVVNMFMKCGSTECARIAFDKLPDKTLQGWTAMVVGYAQDGNDVEALRLFCQMQGTRMKLDQFVFSSILRVIGSLVDLELGKQIHAHITKSGFHSDLSVGTPLLDMYAKCTAVEDARKVFDSLPERNVVSWCAMMAGYADKGDGEEVLNLFKQMQCTGIEPNEFVFSSIFNACAMLGALEEGKQVHANSIKTGLISDMWGASALLTMYARSGSIEDARKVFNTMHERDVVAWTSMIVGYARQGLGREALDLFEKMQGTGMKPNPFVFSSVLSACAILGALQQGKQVHANFIKTGLISNPVGESALVSMYARSGSIDDARKIFNTMLEKDMVAWTTMILGYARHGLGWDTLELFEKMQASGMEPNHLTFVGVLYACSHIGLVNESWQYFNSISSYGIMPTAEHYACMVDILGRAGCLSEAENLISKMPFEPNALVWQTLLGACKVHGNIELGKHAAEFIRKLELEDDAMCMLG